MKMLVIGNSEAVLGFSLVGVRGHVAETVTEVIQALDAAMTDPEVGIVLVTEDMAELIPARMDQLKMRSSIPLVVEIPGPGATGRDRPSLADVVRQAVGVKF